MLNAKTVITCITTAFLLSACASNKMEDKPVNTANLKSLEDARVYPNRASTKRTTRSHLRIQSLEDSAMTIGAQGGLSFASEEINHRMKKDDKYLDSIFNFNAMMLDHGVLPPVLERGDDSLNLNDPDTIRVAARTYKIVKQARFATTPPNWREYLWLAFGKPQLPDRSLLPRDDFEAKIWKHAVRKGWEKGITQAYNIFQQNLARLKRDYNGMLLYRRLLQKKMISPPFVARTELGVTGDGSNMRINDQVLRIVAHPKLQTNAKQWKPIVVKNHA